MKSAIFFAEIDFQPKLEETYENRIMLVIGNQAKDRTGTKEVFVVISNPAH